MDSTAVDYTLVDCILLDTTPRSVQVKTPYGVKWVGRGAIHGADEIGITDDMVGDGISLRIVSWLVDKYEKGEG